MLAELFWIFLKLGATSFGGPAAHTALMEQEFVHRRKWLTRENFLNLIAVTNVIPGPNSTELAIHIGYLRAGWKGFWIAGIGFILPAFFIVTAIAFLYSKFSVLPDFQHFLQGLNAVVLAVIAQAFFRFLKTFFKIKNFRDVLSGTFWNIKQNVLFVFLITIGFYLRWQNVPEISILFNCAVIAFFISRKFASTKHHELGSLFWIFFKIGSLLFGSGYVLLSFLNTELIEKRNLLTESQLMDAISVGQFTPGPVFTTASFIGYLLDGFSGATTATFGIFLPAFLFVALSIPLYKKLSSSPLFLNILDGIVAGSLGLLLFTLWTLSQSLSASVILWSLFLISFILLIFQKIPSALIILGGGILSFGLEKI